MSTSISNLAVIMRMRKEGQGARETTDALNKTTQAADKTKQAGDELSLAWKAVEGVAIAAGVAFLKSIPAMLDQGVAIDRATTALEAYTGGASQAQLALDAVVGASGGALDRFSAMQNATRLFSMGLATNADEVEKLTRGAITLGAAMGKGPQEAFEEFTLLLANQSILRLDTFGISAGVVRQRMQELADQGIAPTDRQARFLIATMEEMDGKLGQLDDAGFEATSSLDRLRAMILDVKAAGASWLSDGLMPIIDGTFAVKDAIEAQRAAIVETSATYSDYLDGMLELSKATGTSITEVDLLTEAEFNLAQAMEQSKDVTDLWITTGEDATTVTDNYTYATKDLETAQLEAAAAAERHAAAIQGIENEFEDAWQAATQYLDIFDDNAWTTFENFTEDAEGHIMDLAAAQAEAGLEWGNSVAALRLLNLDMAENMEKSEALTGFYEQLDRALLDFGDTGEDVTNILDDVADAMAAGTDEAVALRWGASRLATVIEKETNLAILKMVGITEENLPKMEEALAAVSDEVKMGLVKALAQAIELAGGTYNAILALDGLTANAHINVTTSGWSGGFGFPTGDIPLNFTLPSDDQVQALMDRAISQQSTFNLRQAQAATGVNISGGRAFGGPVEAGASYIVGEKGPEIFTPTIGGNITPGVGGDTVVNVYLDSKQIGQQVFKRARAQGMRTLS